MSPRFIAVAMLIVSSLVVAPVGAQDANNSTSTASTSTPAPNGSAEANVSVDLGPTAEVVRWRYADGRWHISVRSDVPTRISVTDSAALFGALSDGSGARAESIPSRGYTLDAGTTTIEMAGETRDGQAAVSVSANGQVVLLRTGAMQTSRPAVPWSTVQLLVLGTATMVGAAAVVLVRRRRDDEDLDYERCT